MSIKVDRKLESELMYRAGTLLRQAGLEYVDDVQEADLAVSFSVGSHSRWLVERKEPRAVIGSDFEGWRHQDWLISGIGGTSYVAGQVCVKLYSIAQGRPVWHGSLRDIVLDADGDFGNSDLQEILATILKAYPPR